MKSKETLANLKEKLGHEKGNCAYWQRKALEHKQEIVGLRAELDMETSSLRKAEDLINRLQENLKVDREMHKCALEDIEKQDKSTFRLITFIGVISFGVGLGIGISFAPYVFRSTPKSVQTYPVLKSVAWTEDKVGVWHLEGQPSTFVSKERLDECQSDYMDQRREILQQKETIRLLRYRISERQ